MFYFGKVMVKGRRKFLGRIRTISIVRDYRSRVFLGTGVEREIEREFLI